MGRCFGVGIGLNMRPNFSRHYKIYFFAKTLFRLELIDNTLDDIDYGDFRGLLNHYWRKHGK